MKIYIYIRNSLNKKIRDLKMKSGLRRPTGEFRQTCKPIKCICRSWYLVRIPSSCPLIVWAAGQEEICGAILLLTGPPPSPAAPGHSTLPRGARGRVLSPQSDHATRTYIFPVASNGPRTKSQVLTLTTPWRRNLQTSTKFTCIFSLQPGGH